MDIPVGVSFDGEEGIALTQGEDRTIAVAIFNSSTLAPVDLSGGVVGVNFPKQGGGVIKRTNGPTAALAVNVSVGPANSVKIVDHGFVTGDPVQVAAAAGGTLPAGLATATPYTLQVTDNDNFQILNASGAVVVMTTQGTVGFNITNSSDLVLSSPMLGLVTLNLRAAVTQVINGALDQAFQVEYTVSGKTRIAVVSGTLDITAQPDP